jgi:carboxylate-amine ligase
VIWHRWPSAGPSEPYGSAAEYRRATQALMDAGAALDPGMLYLDARLAASYPTVEIRVADACTDIDDALLVAALARGLVTTAAAGEMQHTPARSDLLRGAFWRAARFGLGDTLWHPEVTALVPAYDAVAALVDRVRPALADAGDEDLVDDGLVRLSQVGGGATRQRQVFERTETLADVVADLVERTRP